MTVVICMSASGMFVAPLIVFSRMTMKPELLNGTPPGTIAACHPSGWIQTYIFTQWFHHFLMVTKPTTENLVVLILDGHYSHTRNFDVISLGQEHGIHTVCLPPHSTHKLQPLDRAFMRPFKTFYSQEVELWLDNHQFQAVSSVEVGTIFGKAYLQAGSMQTAISGFRKCRIIPYNLTIFGAADFIPDNTGHKETTPAAPFAGVTTQIAAENNKGQHSNKRGCRSNISNISSNKRSRRFNIPGWKDRHSVSKKKRCICVTIRHSLTASFTRTIRQCETWRKGSSYNIFSISERTEGISPKFCKEE